MPSNVVIAALVAAGGLGLYLVYKSKSSAKLSCEEACKGTGNGYAYGGCLATCAATSLFSTGRPNAQVLADDAKHNDDLNGPIKTKNVKLVGAKTAELDDKGYPVDGGPITDDERSTGKTSHPASVPYGMGGNALEYESGCVPAWGAPGWDKCKTAADDPDGRGTIDMWGAEHRLTGESVDMTEVWRYVATRAANPKPAPNTNKVVEQADYHALRSGSFDPKAPDPATQGPVANGDGSYTWLVAGEVLTCGPNHAPALADATHFAYPPQCVPIENQGGLQGTGVQTAYSGDCQSMIDAGFTWNVDHWERLRAGQTAADAKCPPGTSSGTGKQLRPVMVAGLL